MNFKGKNDMDFKFPDVNLKDLWRKWWKIFIIGIIVLWIVSGIYIVDANEQGVVRRFGKLSRITSPGINIHMPYPIESVETPKITEVKRIEIGFRTIDSGPPARYQQVPHESLMLTGDENIVNLDAIVQFKIKDAVDYLFNVRDPYSTVKMIAEASLRQVIGAHKIDEALTEGKFVIQEESMKLMQDILDSYKSGILVIAVQLQDVHPPEEVVDAFRDVASAKEDKNKLINQAEAYKNDIIPKTRGNAERLVREAEAFKQERIKKAQGDTENFLLVLNEYKNAKSITEKRIYIETMEKILPGLKKYIVKTDDKGNILNILNLNKD